MYFRRLFFLNYQKTAFMKILKSPPLLLFEEGSHLPHSSVINYFLLQNALLRRYFIELTQSFMIPLVRNFLFYIFVLFCFADKAM